MSLQYSEIKQDLFFWIPNFNFFLPQFREFQQTKSYCRSGASEGTTLYNRTVKQFSDFAG